MDEALTRLKLAAAAGADVCFIEGVKTKDLLEKTVAELAPTPVFTTPFIPKTIDDHLFMKFYSRSL